MSRRNQTDPSEQLLQEFAIKYGQSMCYAYSHAGEPKQYEEILEGIKRIENIAQLRRMIGSGVILAFDDDISHCILTAYPRTDERHRAVVMPASRYVRELLVQQLRHAVHLGADEIYSTFLQTPFSMSCAGILLDVVIHKKFIGGGCWPLLPMAKSSHPGPHNQHWKSIPGAIHTMHLSISETGFNIGESERIKPTSEIPHYDFDVAKTTRLDSGYYKPLQSQQVTFDGFLYNAVNKHAVIFQATVSETHDVKQLGINQLVKLGAKELTYILITSPDKLVDLAFPSQITDKIGQRFQITLEELRIKGTDETPLQTSV
jgi:hypothetical protein